MRVFRCLSVRELTNLCRDKDDRIAIVKGCNTHHYEKDTNYIHFFRYSASAIYFAKYNVFNMNPKDNYVAYMVANIPNEILEKHFGYGFYNNYNKDFSGETIPLPEYAIPLEKFKKEYIAEININIPIEYTNEEEHQRYLEIIKQLQKKISYNEHELTHALTKYNLQELLGVKDDSRTEEQIRKDKLDEDIKQFRKAFPNGVYD